MQQRLSFFALQLHFDKGCLSLDEAYNSNLFDCV